MGVYGRFYALMRAGGTVDRLRGGERAGVSSVCGAVGLSAGGRRLDFALTGILAGLAAPLAEAGISLFALSAYCTDYILVRAGDLARAQRVLRRAGYAVS